jgi:hypothetical protein
MARVMGPYYQACGKAIAGGRRPPILGPDGVYAGEVRPGDCVVNPNAGWNGDDRGILDVVHVTGPDEESMVLIHALGGPPVRIAGDWGLERYTATTADVHASLLMEALDGLRPPAAGRAMSGACAGTSLPDTRSALPAVSESPLTTKLRAKRNCRDVRDRLAAAKLRVTERVIGAGQAAEVLRDRGGAESGISPALCMPMGRCGRLTGGPGWRLLGTRRHDRFVLLTVEEVG